MTQNSKYSNVVITNAGSGGTFAASSVSDIFNSTWTNTGTTQIKSQLQVDGDANINGDLKVKGQSITETLDKINERLGILVPNEKLEQEWSELAELRQQYVELERRLLEKQRVFDILKKSY